jgi:hypothetical protein
MIDLTKITETKAIEIRRAAKDLDVAIYVFDKIVNSIEGENAKKGITDLEKMTDDFVPLDSVNSAMKHMREFTKTSLMEMSDIELSAVVRFVFEMSLWVSYLAGPVENGRHYFALLALENQRHLQKDIKQMEFEVANLLAADIRENVNLRTMAESAAHSGRKLDVEAEVKKVWLENEKFASANFSIYTDWVKGGNFGVTADYIEKEVLPDLRKKLTEVENRITRLKTDGFNFKKIRTDELARLANMEQEYDWLFSHTSRKIHAEPFSISSDFASHSGHEKFIYIQYFLRKVNEMLEVSFDIFKRRPEFPNGV